jgi:hypothetical protein
MAGVGVRSRVSFDAALAECQGQGGILWQPDPNVWEKIRLQTVEFVCPPSTLRERRYSGLLSCKNKNAPSDGSGGAFCKWLLFSCLASFPKKAEKIAINRKKGQKTLRGSW